MKKVFLSFVAIAAVCVAAVAQCTPTQVYESAVEFSNQAFLPQGVPSAKAIFTVGYQYSKNVRVYFSKGNLQYKACNTTPNDISHNVNGGGTKPGIWQMAEHQYDVIGQANTNISDSYTGWIDLFGYGTSACGSGNEPYNPYETSKYSSNYPTGSISGTNNDWGVYNAISNAGDEPNLWRTLTSAEWKYLFETRTSAAQKYAWSQVGEVKGLVILPDEWENPSSCPTWKYGMTGQIYDYEPLNTYTISQWSDMEVNGAIFLPCTGMRSVNNIYDITKEGYYMTSSISQQTDCAHYIRFSESELIKPSHTETPTGGSVRLVKTIVE